MAQAEMVTVRMSRGHVTTPWGFHIGPQLTIANVSGGSLADRAGLLNGDTLFEFEGQQNLNVELAKQLLAKTEHRVELVVHRTGNASHRIWQPSVTENTEYNRFQHSVHNVPQSDSQKQHQQQPLSMHVPPPPKVSQPANVPQPHNIPLKVSLEHQNQQATLGIPGFNTSAQPFDGQTEVKHLQYNSPMPLYSPQSAAEQYLQQTGGLFGTDPNLNRAKEVPSYLHSETLRLIQESEQNKTDHHHHHYPNVRPIKNVPITQDVRSTAENTSGAPQCFICGRSILGVMCRAYERTMHGDCFQCSTCGSSLKNLGHHFINDKFYCDVHGLQLKGGGGASGGGRDAVDTSMHRAPLAMSSIKSNLRTSYQPDVMTRHPLSISPTPWKTQSPISPSNRGVPPAATHYGQELNDLRREMYNSGLTGGETNKIGGKNLNGSKIYEAMPASNAFGTSAPKYATHKTPSEIIVDSIMEAARRVEDQCTIAGNNNLYTKTSAISSSTHEQSRQTDEATAASRGRGILHDQGGRIPFCDDCKHEIRGAYVLANGAAFCPEHFVCANKACARRLLDVGFVEEKGRKYCEKCFESLIAPRCAKCAMSITADCLNALQKQWHPHCFVCAHCHKPFGNSAFFLEQGKPYCEADWNALFTTKCISCHYPIEAGDRWVEALGSAFHSNCFNCTSCNANLEGESFYAKNGAPYCKLHA